jgi:cytochrome c2
MIRLLFLVTLFLVPIAELAHAAGNIVWTYEDLNTYLYGPSLTKPGGFMEVPSISDDNTRADLIAYLRTLSDTPIPLP